MILSSSKENDNVFEMKKYGSLGMSTAGYGYNNNGY